MNKKLLIGSFVGLILLVGIFSYATSKKSSNTAEPQGSGNSSTQQSNLLPKPKEVILNVNFPKDMPIFPNSRLVSASELPDMNSYLATYEIDNSSATPKQVLEYYVSELPKQNWKTESPISNESTGNYLVSGTKSSREARLTSYLSADDNAKTSINLNVTGIKK